MQSVKTPQRIQFQKVISWTRGPNETSKSYGPLCEIDASKLLSIWNSYKNATPPRSPKGQQISEVNFLILICPKYERNYLFISALASKMDRIKRAKELGGF